MRGTQEDGEVGDLRESVAFEGFLGIDLNGADAGDAQRASDGDGVDGCIGEIVREEDAEDEFPGGEDEGGVACSLVASDEAAVD